VTYKDETNPGSWTFKRTFAKCPHVIRPTFAG
jgi:hypothetical protein